MGFTAGNGNGSIAGSSDVALNSPLDNHALTYNASTSKWRNTALAGVATSGSYSDLANKPNIPLDVTTSGRTPETHIAPYRNVFSPLPIITLRYDDNNIKDLEIANALTAAGLVGSFATVRSRIGADGTRTTLQNLLDFQTAGHEITAHTRTHSAISTDSKLYDEVITATDEMRAMNLYMQCFTEPGTFTDDYTLDSMAKLSSNYYGQLVQANFAASQGYINDGVANATRQIPSALKWGTNHYTWESDSMASQRFVERVISSGGSGEILTHLSQLDTSGAITTQNYLDFITWLVAQRDAGRLIVMTPTAAIYAQRGERLNMLMDPSFEALATLSANYSSWIYASGYAPVAGRIGGNAVRVAAGTGIAQLFRNGEILRSLEMSAWFKSISSDGVARIQFQTYSDVAGTTLLDTTYTTANIVSGVWTKVIFNGGMSPDAKSARITFMSNTGSTQMWIDDAAVYRA